MCNLRMELDSVDMVFDAFDGSEGGGWGRCSRDESGWDLCDLVSMTHPDLE